MQIKLHQVVKVVPVLRCPICKETTLQMSLDGKGLFCQVCNYTTINNLASCLQGNLEEKKGESCLPNSDNKS